MLKRILLLLLILLQLLLPSRSAPPPPSCPWTNFTHDHRCDAAEYAWEYPTCSLFQYPNRAPIPCSGLRGESFCRYDGRYTNSSMPRPASWHIHVFFPNPSCTNCSSEFKSERRGFTFAGAMQFRRLISGELNRITRLLLGRPAADPIDEQRAATDQAYNQCGDAYGIVAGAPANYHREPCIFEVDSVKKGGPFTDPDTGEGYPNYSFFIPGEYWLSGLVPILRRWLAVRRRDFGAYDVLIHPNTGCEVRDHAEPRSIEWLGKKHELRTAIFSCNALGCNQACPPNATGLEPPANCSVSQ